MGGQLPALRIQQGEAGVPRVLPRAARDQEQDIRREAVLLLHRVEEAREGKEPAAHKPPSLREKRDRRLGRAEFRPPLPVHVCRHGGSNATLTARDGRW